MNKFTFSLLLSLLFASYAFSQDYTPQFRHNLKGTIKDVNGIIYPGLSLKFISEKRQDSTSADINGDFEINLPPGRYKVTMDKFRSKDFLAFLDIQENGLNPNDLEFTFEPAGETGEKSWPKIIKSVNAPYPPAARAVRAGGEIIVAITIDKEGKVTAANVESGNPLLRAASAHAARSFLFESSDKDGPREAKLIFVFLAGAKGKEGLRRYTNPFRFEILADNSIQID